MVMKRTCPACGQMNNTLVFTNQFEMPIKSAFYDRYNVVECTCGMIFADDLPSQAEFDAYYQAQAKKSSRFETNDFKEPIWYENIHRSAAGWLNKRIDLKGKKVLDAGCFTGNLMKFLIPYGALCFGYDPSVTGIAVAKHLGLNVSLAGSFCSSEYFGKKFDLITLSHVLEHILDHKAFFEDLDNALTDESLIYIEVPDLQNFHLSGDPNRLVDERDPMLQFNSEHINFFTKQSLWRMMDRLGYETVAIDQVNCSAAVLSGLFKRKKSAKSYCSSYLEECNLLYRKIDKKLSELGDAPIYVWGAGGNTQRNLIHTNMKHLPIKAFIDNNDSLKNDTLAGKPIITPSEISEDYPIVICSLLYMDEISDQIKSMKIKNRVIKLYED